MNAGELVTKAFYLSGVVSRELETVSGSQLADGLDMLNELLDDKAAKGNLIPYYSHLTFTGIVKQEKYFVADLISISALTFEKQEIRYSLEFIDRDRYFGSSRANNIDTLPSIYTFERIVGGANIYVYPLPDETYEFQITGKKSFDNVDQCATLETVFDGFYTSYLRYALAKRISDFYSITFSPDNREELKSLERNVFNVSPLDMTIKKLSTLNSPPVQNYGIANLYKGYLP